MSGSEVQVYVPPSLAGDFWSVSYTPVSRNRLAQEPPPGSTVEFSHSFFSTAELDFLWFWWMQDSYSGVQDNISCVLHGLWYSEGHICFCTTSWQPAQEPTPGSVVEHCWFLDKGGRGCFFCH